MNTPISATLKAWITNDYRQLRDIKRTAEMGDHACALGNLSFTAEDSDMAKHGWTHVGSAQVTFEPLDDDTATLNQIATLKAELESVRASAEIQVRRIEDKIQNLMAITYQPQVPSMREQILDEHRTGLDG